MSVIRVLLQRLSMFSFLKRNRRNIPDFKRVLITFRIFSRQSPTWFDFSLLNIHQVNSRGKQDDQDHEAQVSPH